MSYSGRPQRPWAIVSLNTTQTTNFAVGNHIQFDTVLGNGFVTISSGTGQSLGLITLPKGFYWLLRIFIGGTANEGLTRAKLTNSNDVAIVMPNGAGTGLMYFCDMNSNTNTSATGSSTVVVDATTAQQIVKVDIFDIPTAGFSQWVAGSRIFIEALV